MSARAGFPLRSLLKCGAALLIAASVLPSTAGAGQASPFTLGAGATQVWTDNVFGTEPSPGDGITDGRGWLSWSHASRWRLGASGRLLRFQDNPDLNHGYVTLMAEAMPSASGARTRVQAGVSSAWRLNGSPLRAVQLPRHQRLRDPAALPGRGLQRPAARRPVGARVSRAGHRGRAQGLAVGAPAEVAADPHQRDALAARRLEGVRGRGAVRCRGARAQCAGGAVALAAPGAARVVVGCEPVRARQRRGPDGGLRQPAPGRVLVRRPPARYVPQGDHAVEPDRRTGRRTGLAGLPRPSAGAVRPPGGHLRAERRAAGAGRGRAQRRGDAPAAGARATRRAPVRDIAGGPERRGRVERPGVERPLLAVERLVGAGRRLGRVLGGQSLLVKWGFDSRCPPLAPCVMDWVRRRHSVPAHPFCTCDCRDVPRRGAALKGP